MHVKLSENPKDWRKFVASLGLVLAAVTVILWRRQVIDPEAGWPLLALLLLAVAASGPFPRAFRPVYRVGMTIASWIGQALGMILLSLFFLLVLTPIGLVLRLAGKDLLRRKFKPGVSSYWRTARCSEEFNRMF